MREFLLAITLLLSISTYCQTSKIDSSDKKVSEKNEKLLKALKGTKEEWDSFVKEKLGDSTPTYSGLDAMAIKTGESASVDPRHSDIAREKNLNPHVMNYDDMEKVYLEDKKEQSFFWGFVVIGVFVLIGAGLFLKKISK